MILRDFLDAAYALLVGEIQRQGGTLLDALEKLAPFGHSLDLREGDAEARRERAELLREEREMKRLQAAMARFGDPGARASG